MQSQISQLQKYTSVCLPPVTVLLLLSLLPIPIVINKTLQNNFKKLNQWINYIQDGIMAQLNSSCSTWCIIMFKYLLISILFLYSISFNHKYLLAHDRSSTPDATNMLFLTSCSLYSNAHFWTHSMTTFTISAFHILMIYPKAILAVERIWFPVQSQEKALLKNM